ncbi:MAG: HNH endonuclease [Ignavibacteria bacterium]|nr:HNH endonuclease [Ignavibacteria bacterium]
MTRRIPEKELILPSLFLMNIQPDGMIDTTTLIDKLTSILKPPPEDLERNPSRNDTKFSQKVRNLKSHNTLNGLADYDYTEKKYKITDAGILHLKNNSDIVKYLLVNDFEYSDLESAFIELENNAETDKKAIEVFDENILIQEGIKKITEVSVYERSTLLREKAIDKFKNTDDSIDCHTCDFNFSKFYGVALGKLFIEIHHVKPIFKYEDEDLTRKIDDALDNVIPVCSNCHRMIHRNWKKPLEISYLIDRINENGVFRD